MLELNLFYLFLLVPYLPLIGRLLFFFASDSPRFLHFLNRWVGKGELYFGWLRDVAVSVFILVLFSGRLIEWYQIGIAPAWPFELLLIPFVAYSRWWRWHGLAPMHELARKNPTIHPTEFFEHLHACLGFLPHRVPEKAKRRIDPDHLNFRTGKRPYKSFWILLRGTYNTFLLSILAYKAFAWKGAQYIRLAGSGLSIVWASRLAQIAQMEVKVARPAIKEFPRGKKIFAPNHKSFFDFCLLPLAYYRTKKDGSADNFIPSTMIAKDHFRDNFLLYHVIGFGKMLEAWGNIFVDRKSKEVNKAQVQVTQTVKKLISSDVDFEIYPQGKRAWGQWGRDGDRWDSGYFCVGNKKRLKQEDGHFKKGVAYIACETAFSLLKHRLGGTVTVLPIGINGVGTACPTKSLKVQTEAIVEIKFGEPIFIRSDEMRILGDLSYRDALEHPEYRRRVVTLASQIDQSLQHLLEVPKRLKGRYLTDLREILSGRYNFDEVASALKGLDRDGVLVYAILDCIYALPQEEQRHFMVDLSNSLQHNATKKELLQLKERVAEHF